MGSIFYIHHFGSQPVSLTASPSLPAKVSVMGYIHTWNPNDLYSWRSTPKTRPFPIKTRVIWVLGTYRVILLLQLAANHKQLTWGGIHPRWPDMEVPPVPRHIASLRCPQTAPAPEGLGNGGMFKDLHPSCCYSFTKIPLNPHCDSWILKLIREIQHPHPIYQSISSSISKHQQKQWCHQVKVPQTTTSWNQLLHRKTGKGIENTQVFKTFLRGAMLDKNLK